MFVAHALIPISIFDGIFNLLQDLGTIITSFFSMLYDVIDFTVQIVTAVAGIFKWLIVALDVGREINYLLPWDLATVFSMMTLVSVVFVIFGRVK